MAFMQSLSLLDMGGCNRPPSLIFLTQSEPLPHALASGLSPLRNGDGDEENMGCSWQEWRMGLGDKRRRDDLLMLGNSGVLTFTTLRKW